MRTTKDGHSFPNKLNALHSAEEQLRDKALLLISENNDLSLHLTLIEAAMDIVDQFRQFEIEDEDLKVIQILGMRAFNAFGASLKLALSGYSQNSAMIMRDILETVFLLSLFTGDRTLIQQWRLADKKNRMQVFSPVKVREALDKRDGFLGKKRAEIYELFSELAGHPTMKSAEMMRPRPGGDAVIGPFVEAGSLAAVISEMGKLALQVGQVVSNFSPPNWHQIVPSRVHFVQSAELWLATFFSQAPR